jgi:hypothetical protein
MTGGSLSPERCLLGQTQMSDKKYSGEAKCGDLIISALRGRVRRIVHSRPGGATE